MTRIRAKNAWTLVVAAVFAAIVTAAGVLHVFSVQREMRMKRALFVEMVRNRELARQRDELGGELAEVTAIPRMALRARELLGMRPPRPEERIVVSNRVQAGMEVHR